MLHVFMCSLVFVFVSLFCFCFFVFEELFHNKIDEITHLGQTVVRNFKRTWDIEG